METDDAGEADCRAIIARFNRGHGCTDDDVLFVSRLRDAGLDDRQIARVLEIMDEICQACFDSPDPCHCLNDE